MFVKDRKEFYIDIIKMAGTDTVSREHGRNGQLLPGAY